MHGNKTIQICLVTMCLISGGHVSAEETISGAAQVEKPVTQATIEGMLMSEKQLKAKQEHLLKMHELSNKIISARDSREKQRLMDEQLNLMKEHQLQHHEMMQQHMQEMMKHRSTMPMMSPSPQIVSPPIPTTDTPK